MTYRQLEGGRYTDLRKRLLKRPGSHFQREFIRSARANEDFAAFIRDLVGSEEGDDIPILETKLSENTYKNAPDSIENRMYETWKMVPPRYTCSASFWGEVTLQHIESGRINAWYLAANGESSSDGKNGKKRIDQALGRGGIPVDDCVRTILRRMGGLPEIRGNRSTYVDCSFGRAWWRQHLLEEVANETSRKRDYFREIFYLSQAYWEELINLVVSKNSILGATKARDALIWALADFWKQKYDRCGDKKKTREHKLFTAKSVRHLCRLVGVRSAWQELGILELDGIKQWVKKDISQTLYGIR